MSGTLRTRRSSTSLQRELVPNHVPEVTIRKFRSRCCKAMVHPAMS